MLSGTRWFPFSAVLTPLPPGGRCHQQSGKQSPARAIVSGSLRTCFEMLVTLTRRLPGACVQGSLEAWIDLEGRTCWGSVLEGVETWVTHRCRSVGSELGVPQGVFCIEVVFRALTQDEMNAGGVDAGPGNSACYPYYSPRGPPQRHLFRDAKEVLAGAGPGLGAGLRQSLPSQPR